MKHVKLIAKPNTWFKEGTEVFHYDEYKKLIPLSEFNEWKKSDMILCRGIRVCENPISENRTKVGEEYIDGELCGIDEFEIEIVN